VSAYPGIRFVLSHAGGFVPYAAERMALSLVTDMGSSLAAVLDQFRTFYFDTALSTGAATLPALLAFAQPGHIVFGSDWPFAPQTVVNHFTDGLGHYPGLDDAARWAVYRDNAVALLS
jgi:6-methylsalicylate decarboxylase